MIRWLMIGVEGGMPWMLGEMEIVCDGRPVCLTLKVACYWGNEGD